MRILFTLLLGCLAAPLVLNAQDYEWAKSIGGSDYIYGYSIDTDESGNVYVGGIFNGTADFDPGAGEHNILSVGDQDVFVQKLSASGELVWVRTFGGYDIDILNSLTVDNSGNTYVTGYFQSTVDFDPGEETTNHTSLGGNDIFIQKMDSDGNFLWANAYGDTETDQGFSICTDELGHVYIAGVFTGTVDFDPEMETDNHTSSGGTDIFVQKLDATTGSLIWTKSFGGSSNDQGLSLIVNDSGEIYTTGTFLGFADFDPGGAIASYSVVESADVFVQKLDSSGSFIWAKTFGGTSYDQGKSIALDEFGNVYTTGKFRETVDLDPNAGSDPHTASGVSDIFIQKLDSSGEFIWANTFGGSSSEDVHSSYVDESNNIYTTGYFSNNVDFDSSEETMVLSSLGSANDVFVQKIDESGNFLWATSYGGFDTEQGFDIVVDNSANIYTTGTFEGTVDFDPSAVTENHTSLGQYDTFVHKMSQCLPTASTDVQIACDSYTWIDGNSYTESNNLATWALTNEAGCDSIVTLDLTINSVNSTITQTNDILTSAQSGATYQWIDCSDMSPINGATDQSFTPIASGNYAVIVSNNGCEATSDCENVTIVGLLENEFGSELVLYPNPMKGQCSIDLGTEYSFVRVTVENLNGSIIQSRTFNTQRILDLTIDQPAGIYFVSIESHSKSAKIKLVKE